MSLPGQLVTTALLGAGRGEFAGAASLRPELSALWAALSERPPEEALLLMIGAAALHDTAGRLPERALRNEWPLPAFRPEGDLRPCSPAAARLLERMLNQQDTALLPELLKLLSRAQQRAPDSLLPQVLEHGAKISRLRPQLLPILGERGRWLAAINPVWRYAAVDTGDPRSLRGAWDADPAGRPALAHSVRRRDPAAGRRLIESTWRAEPETARRELLAALEADLAPDDEPFLERALDDRDAQVRRRAADLLSRLPDSRLVERITAAAGTILVLKDGGLAPNFPGPITDSMMRDGVVRYDNPSRASAVRSSTDWSRLIIQTVGVISPAHWEARFGLDAEGVIRLAQAGKWPRTLLTALATAALRRQDPLWADALLAADGYTEKTGILIPLLTPADCFARLASRIAGNEPEVVAVFMRRWPHAWDEPTGRSLIDFLARQSAIDPETRTGPTLRFLSRQFAHRCPTSLAGYAAETLHGRESNLVWQGSLRHIVNLLALRRDLHRAVAADLV
ncbi:MAG: hypothetical protein KA170_00735 [Candidatus Promineofilum sp.]|nr:hypothetical protein [Promineifilum sp.]